MKIIYLDTVHPILEERLVAANHQCIQLIDSDFESTKNLISDAEGIVIRSRFPMDAKLLDFAPNLKFIARSGAGMENIDLEYCSMRNIQLFNAPEGNRNAVGEHALGMLLALLNNLVTADAEVRSGKWDREGNRGIELDGKTVGIIGYGNNGEAFAKKLRGFEVQILAYDKYRQDFGNEFVKESSLEELYAKADVISFHIPQNAETLFWANDAFFESIQKPFFLLNLSRGKIVETKALLNAIENGKVLGAGLDVLEFEKASFENFLDGNMPESFQNLLASKKVILSPHVGGWTNESYFKLSDVLADKILQHFQ